MVASWLSNTRKKKNIYTKKGSLESAIEEMSTSMGLAPPSKMKEVRAVLGEKEKNTREGCLGSVAELSTALRH